MRLPPLRILLGAQNKRRLEEAFFVFKKILQKKRRAVHFCTTLAPVMFYVRVRAFYLHFSGQIPGAFRLAWIGFMTFFYDRCNDLVLSRLPAPIPLWVWGGASASFLTFQFIAVLPKWCRIYLSTGDLRFSKFLDGQSHLFSSFAGRIVPEQFVAPEHRNERLPGLSKVLYGAVP
ncbi:hypothetical protein C0583_06720 [Candidatus Parcubacteria bacterium]|nr:MAG: hypothetical protein C0583_06720 [Candidatus Parcubacteria bacterium]